MGWFKKHKVLTVILAFIIIAVIVGASNGDNNADGDNNSSSQNTSTNSDNSQKTYKFDERADKQPKDIEVLPGEAAIVDGVKMTLSNVEYKTNLSDYEKADDGKTFAVADVSLENTSDKTQSYNVFDFRIQTAGGQVLDGAITSLQTLSSGDLVTGGKATGKIIFEAPVEEGHEYIIWKPDAYHADRAVVRVK